MIRMCKKDHGRSMDKPHARGKARPDSEQSDAMSMMGLEKNHTL